MKVYKIIIKYMNIKRNGDWNLKGISEAEFTKLSAKGTRHESNVFAEGEATNHFHAVKTKSKEDFDLIKMEDGSYLMHIKKDGVITHPEHSLKTDLEVKTGYYRLYKGREKDWFSLATRKLID
jgi:hypothetical protein